MKYQLPNGSMLDLPDDISKDELRGMVDKYSPPEKSLWDSTKDFATSTKEGGLSDSLLRSLPAVGATAGAVIGSPALLTGPWGAAVPVGGAALGGAAGSSVEDFLRRVTGVGKQPETPGLNPLKAGAEMGAFEMGAGGLLGILSKIGAPNAAKLAANPDNSRFADFALKNELPMSPSTIQPSFMSRLTESMTNMFPTGKAISSYYQNKTYKWLLNSRQQIIEDLTGIAHGEPGKRLIEATSDVKAGLKSGTNEGYAAITPEIGGAEATIPMENTAKYLRNLYENGLVSNNRMKSLIADFESKLIVPGETAAKGAGGYTQRQLDYIANNKESFLKRNQHMEDPEGWFMKNLVDNMNPGAANVDQSLLKPMAMKAKDFENWQSTINSKAKTKDEFSTGENIWEMVNKDIKSFDAAQGTELADIVKNAKMDARSGFRYQRLTGMFDKATAIGQDGAEMFSPGKFYTIIMNDKNQKYLAREFGEDTFANLKTYAEFAMKAAEETAKMKMSGIGQVWQAGMVGGAGLAAATTPALLVPYGASAITAYMVMKPRGVFKQWLTTGFKGSEGASQALKVGGRAVEDKFNKLKYLLPGDESSGLD